MSRNKQTALMLAVLMLILTVLSGCRERAQAPDSSVELPALRIGSDEYLPYFYTDTDGNFAGIDVELAREACRRLGLRAEFYQITWNNKDDCLEEGEVDCLWGCFSMTGRENSYLWAGPYMSSRQVLMVSDSSDIQTLADLENRRVGVQFSSKPDELFSAGAAAGYPQVKFLYCFSGTEELLAALRKGYVDAIAGHETMLREHMKTAQKQYRILEEPLLKTELGVAFSLSADTRIAEQLNRVFDEMRKDGFIAGVLERYGVDPETAEVTP